LHPLLEEDARGKGVEIGGRKKSLNFFCREVGGDKKTITFAARFGRNGSRK